MLRLYRCIWIAHEFTQWGAQGNRNLHNQNGLFQKPILPKKKTTILKNNDPKASKWVKYSERMSLRQPLRQRPCPKLFLTLTVRPRCLPKCPQRAPVNKTPTVCQNESQSARSDFSIFWPRSGRMRETLSIHNWLFLVTIIDEIRQNRSGVDAWSFLAI